MYSYIHVLVYWWQVLTFYCVDLLKSLYLLIFYPNTYRQTTEKRRVHTRTHALAFGKLRGRELFKKVCRCCACTSASAAEKILPGGGRSKSSIISSRPNSHNAQAQLVTTVICTAACVLSTRCDNFCCKPCTCVMSVMHIVTSQITT